MNCGVGLPGKLKLEQCARNGLYHRKDNQALVPKTGFCYSTDNPENTLVTKIPLPAIVSEARKNSESDMSLGISSDAGLYLCEYIYYHSLRGAVCNSVFLHVPPFDMPYPQPHLLSHVAAIMSSLTNYTQRSRLMKPVDSSISCLPGVSLLQLASIF